MLHHLDFFICPLRLFCFKLGIKNIGQVERRPKILLQCVALYVHVTQNKEVGIQKDDSFKTSLGLAKSILLKSLYEQLEFPIDDCEDEDDDDDGGGNDDDSDLDNGDGKDDDDGDDSDGNDDDKVGPARSILLKTL